MIYVESSMLLIVIYTCVKASISDCTTGLISNNLIKRSGCILVLLDLVYYIIFDSRHFLLFLSSQICVALIAFFFYSYNLWAAGDSKLLFVTCLGLPARLYSFLPLGPMPSFAILIIVFSVAYIYVVCESLVIGMRDKNLMNIKISVPKLRDWIFPYLFIVGSMRLVNFFLMSWMGDYFTQNSFLMISIDFFCVLSLMQIKMHLSKKVFYLSLIAEWIIISVLMALKVTGGFALSIDWKSWSIVLIVMGLRALAEKYNYKEIPTESVKARMILSASTIMRFQTSRVKGLPTCTTEDLRARISEEEAAAVIRWKNSKQGKDTIVIVRKIPFALFISIGVILFVMMEMIGGWRAI